MTDAARKIVYVVDDFVDVRAGTEGQLLQLLRLLDRSRYRPAVALLRPSPYVERNGLPCPVRVLDVVRLRSLRSVCAIVRFALAMRREGYALAHCVFNDTSMIVPPLLRPFGIRVIVSRRDMGFWYTPARLFVLRRVRRFVDRYVANSLAVKRCIEEAERVPTRRVTVVYNGCAVAPDAAAAPPSDLSRDGPIVGAVANLRPIKRLDLLVAAFAIVAETFPGARLVIVGDDASPQAADVRRGLASLARRLGIADRIVFAGAVDTPSRYIERFDVAVLCSDSEGFPNAILEYMHCGRPVVCTDAGGNAELVEDARSGFLVPVGDAAALAERILRVLCDADLARRFGERGRQIAATFTGERMAAETMACYDDVLAGRPGGSTAAAAARAATAAAAGGAVTSRSGRWR